MPAEDEKFRFSCPHCGLLLGAGSRDAGRSLDCLACGRPVPVPPAPPVERLRAITTTRRPPSTVRRPPAAPDGWRRKARWSLFLALIPLGLYTFLSTDDLQKRIDETKKQHPDFAKRIRAKGTIDDVLETLPSKRIEGAALSRSTSAHWLMALLSALIFWEFILIVQPMGTSTSRQLWAVGIFTGTIGILMLLIIQAASIIVVRADIRGGVAFLFFLVLRFIGYSYGAAADENSHFIASMIGFTLGVGLLEEFFKALPIFWTHSRSGTLDLRGSVVWGLATGIGFGVSEGISYSGDFYNGLYGGDIYVVRFISCVALHAVWSATVAILIWNRRRAFRALPSFHSVWGALVALLMTSKRRDAKELLSQWWRWFPLAFGCLWISMVLHGFYDTVLKKGVGLAALASAMLSFALFFWLYDRGCRQEAAQPSAAAAA
jgi:RsiW-degrading membrane proteinase PrsW (M82 family)